MNKYQLKKAKVRQEAIEWQITYMSEPMTCGEISYWCERFAKLGKRYGLLKEFRENGIC